MKISKDTEKALWMLFAFIILLSFVGTLIMLIIKGNFEQAVLLMIGQLSGALLAIVSYKWGSSQGSAEKTELIHNSKPIRNE